MLPTEMTISLPFHIFQSTGEIPALLAWNRYLVRAEPPRIGRYKEYPPPVNSYLASIYASPPFTQHKP